MTNMSLGEKGKVEFGRNGSQPFTNQNASKNWSYLDEVVSIKFDFFFTRYSNKPKQSKSIMY